MNIVLKRVVSFFDIVKEILTFVVGVVMFFEDMISKADVKTKAVTYTILLFYLSIVVLTGLYSIIGVYTYLIGICLASIFAFIIYVIKNI